MTRGFHKVNFRFVVIPSEPLVAGGMVPISATKEDIRAEIEIGRKDGTRIAKEWLKINKKEGAEKAESSEGKGLYDKLFPSYD